MSVNVGEIGWQASGKGGAVAAGGAEAVAAGMRMLEQGGNAADAAVATIVALSVTDFGAFAFGGEVPFMFYDARSGGVRVLSGQGGAPLSEEAIRWYWKNGIPRGGDMKSAAVPGAPDLCVTALQQFGTFTFTQVVEPTLELLARGTEGWHLRLAATLRRMTDAEQAHKGSREDALRAAADRFYKGDIADELVAYYTEKGGFLRNADLAAHQTRLEEPVSIDYRGYTVCKCGTWTQGPSLCQALKILEGYDLSGMGHLSADHVHAAVESLKLAFADRDEYYGDPVFVDVPLRQLFSEEYAVLRRTLIDMKQASTEPRPGDPVGMTALRSGPASFRPAPGGTTTCVCADRHGNVVAATPSCNDVQGAKGIDPRTGVAHGSRLTSLNTTPDHPNRIEAGKRPRITLTPTLVLKAGKPVIAISVAGGDLQDQTTLNVFLNAVDFAMPPHKAVTAPRFATHLHENSFNPAADRRSTELSGDLMIQPGAVKSCGAELRSRGHVVRETEGPIANPVMLYIDAQSGVIHAAGDPQAKRHAAAIDE